MREIKFRCWSKERKGIGIITKINFLTNECDYSLGKKKGNTDFGWTSLDNVILMQYTGLKDKNGKEIYEGDIIRNTKKDDEYEYLFVVEFTCDAYCGYCIKGKDESYTVYNRWEDLEVIGNIYENSELIE